MFSLGGVRGDAGPPDVHLGPPNISETTTAGKLNLEIPLDTVKYPFRVQNFFFRQRHLGGAGPPNVNWGHSLAYRADEQK